MSEITNEEIARLSETCPTCGIARYYLEQTHSTALPHIDACPDDFHEGRDQRAERATQREAKAEKEAGDFAEWLKDPANKRRWDAALSTLTDTQGEG